MSSLAHPTQRTVRPYAPSSAPEDPRKTGEGHSGAKDKSHSSRVAVHQVAVHWRLRSRSCLVSPTVAWIEPNCISRDQRVTYFVHSWHEITQKHSQHESLLLQLCRCVPCFNYLLVPIISKWEHFQPLTFCLAVLKLCFNAYMQKSAF